MDIPKDFFHDPNETLLATLGQGYLENWILHGQINKTSMILSDRRVYACGKIILKIGSSISSIKGKQAVSIEQVTGTGYIEKSLPLHKIIGWVLTIMGIIGVFGRILVSVKVRE